MLGGLFYFFPFASFPGELRYFLHHQAVSGTRISQLQEVTGSLWLSHICANCNLERNKNKIPFFFPRFGLSKHLLEKYQKANQLSESSAENILIAEYFDSYYYRYPSGHTHRNINFLDMITIAKRRFFPPHGTRHKASHLENTVYHFGGQEPSEKCFCQSFPRTKHTWEINNPFPLFSDSVSLVKTFPPAINWLLSLLNNLFLW